MNPHGAGIAVRFSWDTRGLVPAAQRRRGNFCTTARAEAGRNSNASGGEQEAWPNLRDRKIRLKPLQKPHGRGRFHSVESANSKEAGLAICCPITSQVKGYPFEVALPAGLPVSGVILADQVKSLDWRSRRATLIARLPDAVVEDLLLTLGALLQMQGD